VWGVGRRQNFLGFGPQPAIEVDFGGGDRQHVMVKGDSVGSVETVPLFTGTETIGGQVSEQGSADGFCDRVLATEGACDGGLLGDKVGDQPGACVGA